MQPQPDNQTLSLILSGHLKDLNWDSFPESDWNALIQHARMEGVTPLVYWAFSKSEKLAILPPSVRNDLRMSYAGTWMRNQGYLKELDNLLQVLTREDIPVILLKGICFILTIYPDIGLRPMGDVDILVPRPKWEKAVSIAQSLGYENNKPDASPGLHDLLGHDVCLQKMGSLPITLELHHSLVADKTFTYAVPVDWFWEQTEPLGGTSLGMEFKNLLILTPVAQIIYAASHAMLQHGGKNVSLCWYYDLDRLICNYKDRLDWEQLLSQARTFEWGSALSAALVQTDAYFHSPIPENVFLRLAERVDRHAQLVALKQTRPATHVLDEHQKLLSLNWYGRLRLVLALVFPSPAYMRWRYGLKSSWAVIACYPFRWWGITKDAFRTVVALVKKTPVTRT